MAPGAGTAYPTRAHGFTLVFSGVRVSWSFGFCVMFCRSLSSFCWPFYWTSFLDLQICITSLVSETFLAKAVGMVQRI